MNKVPKTNIEAARRMINAHLFSNNKNEMKRQYKYLFYIVFKKFIIFIIIISYYIVNVL